MYCRYIVIHINYEQANAATSDLTGDVFDEPALDFVGVLSIGLVFAELGFPGEVCYKHSMPFNIWVPFMVRYLAIDFQSKLCFYICQVMENIFLPLI